ncbi:MAG: FAD-binding protein [Halieaceae bacterium]|nr:FAD-binding protein [Halieaceae bacterium]
MRDRDLSTAIAEQLRTADAASPLRITGACSKPWMAQTGAGLLPVAAHRGVVDYTPGELVISVRAGTPLAELEAVLAERGQMLGAECPNFSSNSTIGGAVALGWSGSRSGSAGPLRDFVLGLRMINGLGEILHFGGRVMKNVAGFDVPRLLAGSVGRLGVILDVSLKVLPLPEAELTLCRELASEQEAGLQIRKLQQRALPLSGAVYYAGKLYLRFSGRPRALQQISIELPGEEIDNSFWQELTSLRLAFFSPAASGELHDCLGGSSWFHRDGCLWRRQGEAGAVNLRDGPGPAGGTLAALQQRLHQAFDPRGLFNAPLQGSNP